ncbi:helix-turn-helix domain-containing protein [Staphylococcus warneri]|uniref:helix-turn-helix domain-containing protein n=1 Tax=Staphylococcus warneri TaxID=1292 RepID=UPI0031D8F59D
MKVIKCAIKREELDRILNERNMTYTQFASEIYIDQTYLSRLVNGERYISDNVRRNIQNYLKVEFDDLFEQVEINKVNGYKTVPELVLNKEEVNELIETGVKEIFVSGKKINLKVVN